MCAILYFNLTSLKLLNPSHFLSSSVDDIVYAHDSDSDFDEPYDSKTSLSILKSFRIIIMIIIIGECFRGPHRGTHGNPEHPPLLRRGNLSEWGGKVIRMVEVMMVGDGE